MSVLLAPAELIYRGVNRLRRVLFARGILRSERVDRPVVSIGNRAVGGAGKTPTTIAIARGMLRRGVRPVILTRGYGRAETAEPLLVDGTDPRRFGDEPVLMHTTLPDVPVVVGSRRAEAARWFLQQGDCDVFLLDDGFQHLQLAREVDVVIENPAARWHREGRSALRHAGIVIARDRPAAPDQTPPLFRGGLEPYEWILDGRAHPAGSLRGRRACAFSGLADNEQFFRTLAELGVELGFTRGFPDHRGPTEAELNDLLGRCSASGATFLLTTEKDAVKIGSRAGIAVLRVRMAIEPEGEFFRALFREAGLRENIGHF